MTLESIVNPFSAVDRPLHMFFAGVIYASLAVFLSIWIFRDSASLIMVFLTVFASISLMYSTMKMEEDVSVRLKDEISILKRHAVVIRYLMFLFMGFVVAYTLWFLVLPDQMVALLFEAQMETIAAINANVVGLFNSSGGAFFQIFLNNFKVLLFCLFFSFFYGAGAIFILTWNASVIAAALGAFINSAVSSGMHITGAIPFSILRYALHGIPEIIAYIAAGLAGGIISVAMMNRDLETNKFRKIVLDVIDLSLIAILILIIAAMLEVYVTPLFFS
ncbi:stage II sporulation protein M [archaeon]|nr:stage II sporulation protein M [archaeon]